MEHHFTIVLKDTATNETIPHYYCYKDYSYIEAWRHILDKSLYLMVMHEGTVIDKIECA